MKDSVALQSLAKITENYDRNVKALNAAKQRIRTLTKQRDEANARNAELRQHIARYQAQLALARREWETSAWDGVNQLEAA